MKNKKSFVLYADLIHTVEKLPNDKAGELFKHILQYVNDENPQTDDLIVNISFEPIKQQLKRDLEKWQEIREKRSEAGKKSAESKKQQRQQVLTSVESVEQTPTKSTVNVNDNVNVTVNDNVINKEEEFKNSLTPFLGKYDSQLLENFFLYWSEKNEGGKKMRFEYSKNQPFNISRRLATWSKREKEYKKEKSSAKKEKGDRIVNAIDQANRIINIQSDENE